MWFRRRGWRVKQPGSLQIPGFSSHLATCLETSLEAVLTGGPLCFCLTYLTMPMGQPQALPHVSAEKFTGGGGGGGKIKVSKICWS